MDENRTDLELDITIINEPRESAISLSDIYGIPVFREDSYIAIRNYELLRDHRLGRISENVFEEAADRNSEIVEIISAKLFAENQPLVQAPVREAPSVDNMNLMIIGFQVVGVLFIVLLGFYIKRRNKKREVKLDDIKHFSS